MPPSTALAAARAQDRAETRLTLMPMTRAACWSSATARMATPRRERLKKIENAPMAAAATAMATRRFLSTKAPMISMLPLGRNAGACLGSVPQTPRTMAVMTPARPMVTMITEMKLSPTSGRRANRSMAIPMRPLTRRATGTAMLQCHPHTDVIW
jgi:hypothetical protein